MKRATGWVGYVYQDGMRVASVSSRYRRNVAREIAHYALVYGQDGPVSVRIRKIVRRKARKAKK